MKFDIVFQIEELAQNFTAAPQVYFTKKNLFIKYDYENEEGIYDWTGLTFIDAICYKMTRSDCLSVKMISAYNTLININESIWIQDVINPSRQKSTDYNHYMILFEDYGCYEVVAAGVKRGI